MANPQNLKPLTTKKAREIGRKGGIASGKAKKEKRLMSQIFAELLSNGLDKDIEKTTAKVIRKGGGPAVSLMKTIAEVTEGSKIKTESAITINTDDEKIQAILKEHGIIKPEN